MKKIILTLCLIGSLSAVKAQMKPKLPATVKFVFTERQILTIDSAINTGASWTDSKASTIWYSKAFTPFYEQLNKQLVVDTIKVKPKTP